MTNQLGLPARVAQGPEFFRGFRKTLGSIRSDLVCSLVLF